MSVKLCQEFASAVKFSAAELDALKSLLLTSPDLAEKLETHLTYLRKRPGVVDSIKTQWLAKLPIVAPVVNQAPPALTSAPPPLAKIEYYTHAAIAGCAAPCSAPGWTIESAMQANATAVWRNGMAEWLDLAGTIPSVQPTSQPTKQAKPAAPIVDGFPIPWPDSVELAKNGKLYANLRGSLKPMGRGKIGIELTMLKALLGDDSQYRKAIMAEVERLGG
jgi:hypothetical protein